VVRQGLASEAAVDAAWTRSYTLHLAAGRFDDPARAVWATLGLDDVYSSLHQQIQREAALQASHRRLR
jgi:hypothetical protein